MADNKKYDFYKDFLGDDKPKNKSYKSEEEIEDINTPDADLVWDYSWSAFNEYYHWEIDEHDDDWETVWLSDEE